MTFNRSTGLSLKAAIVASVAILSSAPASGACSVTAAPIAFGAYNGVTKAEVQTTTSVTVQCNDLLLNTSFTVGVSPGQSGNATARYLVNGPYKLTYQVYADSARTRIAGDGSAGTISPTGSVAAIAGIGTTSSSVLLYPVIMSGQSPAPGAYTDSLTVLISY